MNGQSADSDARTVFLVDGWISFRRSLRLFLEAGGHRVAGEADTVDQAADMDDVRAADVFVLEPSLDWPHLEHDLTKLRFAAPAAGVVLLSSESAPPDLIFRAVRFGVSAYLTKDDDPAAVLRAIEAALSKEFVMLPRDLMLIAAVRLARPTVFPTEAASAAKPQLTRRELEILRLAAASYSNRRIAETLWVTHGTVQFHLELACRKLGVSTRAAAVASASRLGLLGREGDQAA
jgi:DNA-binding NarL/FixJ family response regulator